MIHKLTDTPAGVGLPNRPILRDNWDRFKQFEKQILHFVRTVMDKAVI